MLIMSFSSGPEVGLNIHRFDYEKCSVLTQIGGFIEYVNMHRLYGHILGTNFLVCIFFGTF